MFLYDCALLNLAHRHKKVFVTFLESSIKEVQESEHVLVHCVEIGHFSVTQCKILSKF